MYLSRSNKAKRIFLSTKRITSFADQNSREIIVQTLYRLNDASATVNHKSINHFGSLNFVTHIDWSWPLERAFLFWRWQKDKCRNMSNFRMSNGAEKCKQTASIYSLTAVFFFAPAPLFVRLSFQIYCHSLQRSTVSFSTCYDRRNCRMCVVTIRGHTHVYGILYLYYSVEATKSVTKKKWVNTTTIK